LEFLDPNTGKKLLTKGEQAACRAMPGDPPEAHQHSIHWDVNEPDNSEGPIMAEIALLYVKWKMRLVVVREPNVRGTTKDRTRALMEVLKDLETRQIPARGFIEDLRRRFKFSAIKFSMDTAIKACMASGLSWLDGSKGPAASLGWERATCFFKFVFSFISLYYFSRFQVPAVSITNLFFFSRFLGSKVKC
jgi:hypothetical protein